MKNIYKVDMNSERAQDIREDLENYVRGGLIQDYYKGAEKMRIRYDSEGYTINYVKNGKLVDCCAGVTLDNAVKAVLCFGKFGI